MMEPMECVHLGPGELSYGNAYVQKLMAVCIDKTEEAIVEACIACAEKEGVTDLYLIDRQFVIDALREKKAREILKTNSVGNRLILDDKLLRIREKIACPQLGDDHYGEWCTLQRDQRRTIADLIHTVEYLDKLVRRYMDSGEDSGL